MVDDGLISEFWLTRLAQVRPPSLLDPLSVVNAGAPAASVDPAAIPLLNRLTGNDPVGLLLIAIAALRLALAAYCDDGPHAVLIPAPPPAPHGRELALSTPLDPRAPASAFLTALHGDLESSLPLAWPDRSAVIRRLAAVGSLAATVLPSIGVRWEHDENGSTDEVTVTLTLRRTPAGLDIEATGPGGRLPAGAIALPRCVSAAMAAIAADPQRPSGEIDLLGAAQRTELMDWARFPAPEDFPSDTVTRAVDAAAQRNPDGPAVISAGAAWTHAQLRTSSGSAARLLADRYGIARGDRVAVLLPRGPGLVLAKLAVLRAGASYVPLDPAHPPARLGRQLALASPRLVVTVTGLSALPGSAALPSLPVDELLAAPRADPPASPAPDDEAILLFTSGSTGQPRPVALTHRQLAYKALSSGHLIGFNAATRCALVSSISSDALFYQVFTTLASGGCLVPVDAVELTDPSAFWALVERYSVNTLNCVPSLLAVLTDGLPTGQPRHLRTLILGGDEIPRGMLPRLADRLAVGTFANLYGPTEATVEATSFLRVGGDLAALAAVPIGRPSPGFAVAVLSRRGDLTPVGVPGEIYILGPGVAAGYLDEEPAGPGRFLELKSHPGVPAFRTGDFGRWGDDGELEFLGRRDDQVQMHGNRVELGEVSAALSGIRGVGAVAVVARPDSHGLPRIIAAYTATPQLQPVHIRAALAEQLPGHMIPSRLLRLDELPVTPLGKVDRTAITAYADSLESATWDPEDASGRLVVKAWTEVLGTPPAQEDEDLFTVGGHSLTAAMLAARLCGHADADVITVRQVFSARTPTALSAILRAALELPVTAAGAAPRPGKRQASSAQRRLWFLEQYEGGDVRPYNVVEAFKLHRSVSAADLSEALSWIVGRHEALRTVLLPNGDGLDQAVLAPALAAVGPTVVTIGSEGANEALRRVISVEERRKINLSAGPMFRATWLTESDADSGPGTLVLSAHHSVCDGWSVAVILRDLLHFLDRQGKPELPAPVQYADHCVAQETRHHGPEGERSRSYWGHALAGVPGSDLPLDRPRRASPGTAGGTVRFTLSESARRRLAEVTADAGATPFLGMVAAVRVLLYHLCGSRDVLLGSVTAGRDAPSLASSVGMFANTVVLRTAVAPDRNFRDLVAAVARHAWMSREHDDYPLDALVEELGAAREPGRNPLFDVFVESLLEGPSVIDAEAAHGIEPVRFDSTAVTFDLVFSVGQSGPTGPSEVSVSYRSDVFNRGTARRIADRLRVLLDLLIANLDTPVEAVCALLKDRPPVPASVQAEPITVPGDPAEAPGPPPSSETLARIMGVWSAVLRDRVVEPDTSLFDMGGHSLSALRISRELNIPVGIVFEHPTARRLARAIAGRAVAPAMPASPPPQGAEGIAPLSRAQLRVWLTSRRTSADTFIVSVMTRVGRRLVPEHLRAALEAVVARQEMLRAHARRRGAKVELIVVASLPDGVPLRVVDLPGASFDSPSATAALRAARGVSFDLERAPLFEVRLLTGLTGGDIITITAHHLVFDAASVQILLTDLFDAYEQAVGGRLPVLPALSYTFREWVADEATWLVSDDARADEAFWRERLADTPPTPDLADARPRGIRRGLTGWARRDLPATVVAEVPVTPFAVVFTAFAAAIHRGTHARDLVIGFAAGLRDDPRTDETVGYLANTVPLRLRIDPRGDLGTLTTHVRERMVEALEHSRLPFDVIVERLGLRSGPGRSVLLDLGVSWENATVGPEEYAFEDVLGDDIPATSDVWLSASLQSGRLHLDLSYDDNLLSASQAGALADRIVALVQEAAARPSAPVADTAQAAGSQDSWSGTRYDI